MTDTKDIAALRRRSNNLRTAGQTDAFIDLLLDKLEAERQRADDLQHADYLTWHASACKNYAENIRLKEENAALKGKQVPVECHRVCQVLIDDAWIDVSYGAMENQKKHGVEARILFTAPQKPVVLPGISELIDACDSTPAVRDVHVWDLAISEVKRLNPSLFSDKSAAGGIVKDGE